MSIEDKGTLQAQINALFPDNVSGLITPSSLRTYLNAILDSNVLQVSTTVEDNISPVNLSAADIDQNVPRIPILAGPMVYNLPSVAGVTPGVGLSIINEVNEARSFVPDGADTVLGATGITTPGIAFITADPANNQWLSLVEPFAPYISSENVIVINSADDFPPAVLGVRELIPAGIPEIVYIIAAKDIDMGSDVFTITNGECVIRGVHRTASRITTAGTGAMFTVTGSSFFQEFLAVDCPNANVFDYTGSGLPNAIANQNLIVIGCDGLGTIAGAFTTSFRTLTVVNTATSGLTWTGNANMQINMSNCLALDWSGTLFDLGTATFDLIAIEVGNRFESSVGNTILSGAAASANLNAGGISIVDGNIFTGDGVLIDTIDTNDLQWDFKNNVFADNTTKNTRNVVGAFLPTTRIVPIAATSVYVPIGGPDWTFDFNDRFTVGADGLITYIGLSDIDIECNYSVSAEKVGGGADLICCKIAIDGVVSDKTISCTDNPTPTGLSSGGLFSITNGQTIQLWMSNEDSTSNINVSVANLRITGG